MSGKHGDFNNYHDYLNATKVGEDIGLHFKMPIPRPDGGGISFPGVDGKFIWAYENGIVIRSEKGEAFFEYKDLQFFDFPSSIQTVKNSSALQQKFTN